MFNMKLLLKIMYLNVINYVLLVIFVDIVYVEIEILKVIRPVHSRWRINLVAN